MEPNRQAVRPIQVNEAQAAEILGGVSRRTLYNWRRAGLIAYVQAGDRIMYRLSELERFSKANEVPATVSG